MAAGYSLGKAQAKNFPKDGPIHVLMGVSAPGQTWSEQRASGVLKFMDDFKKDNAGREVTVDKIDSGTDLAVAADRGPAPTSTPIPTRRPTSTPVIGKPVSRGS